MARLKMKSRMLRAYLKRDSKFRLTDRTQKFHLMKWIDESDPRAGENLGVGQSVCNTYFGPHNQDWVIRHIEDIEPDQLCQKCFAGFDLYPNGETDQSYL